MLTGIELLQVISSAFTVAEFTFKIVRSIEGVRHVDHHIKELAEKVKQLHGNVLTIRSLGEQRRDQNREKSIPQNESEIWQRIEISLEKSKELLEEFEKEFKYALDTTHRISGMARRVTVELRLQWSQREIEVFQHNLDAQVQTTQLCVLSLLV
jgi:hypothetical protein